MSERKYCKNEVILQIDFCRHCDYQQKARRCKYCYATLPARQGELMPNYYLPAREKVLVFQYRSVK